MGGRVPGRGGVRVSGGRRGGGILRDQEAIGLPMNLIVGLTITLTITVFFQK